MATISGVMKDEGSQTWYRQYFLDSTATQNNLQQIIPSL
jgi:hypothetical protein